MISKVRIMGNEVNSLRICIDRYEDEIPIGCVYHSRQESPCFFKGWMPLIKELNRVMDSNDFPQVGMNLRTFQSDVNTKKQQCNLSFIKEKKIHGDLATFRIRIAFRQNATWQGMLRWVESGKEEHFRSVLELMNLIDSCFTESEKSNMTDLTNRTQSAM